MAESTVYVYRPRLTLVFSLNIEQKRFSHLRNHSQRHHGAFLSLVSIIQNQPSPGLWVWFIGRRWVRGWLTSLFRLGLLFILPGNDKCLPSAPPGLKARDPPSPPSYFPLRQLLPSWCRMCCSRHSRLRERNIGPGDIASWHHKVILQLTLLANDWQKD